MRCAPVIVSLAVLIATLAGPRTASACSCMRPPEPLAALDKADLVFAGKVIELTESADSMAWTARMEIARDDRGRLLFKGEVEGDTVTIHTASNSAACGFRFEDDESYLVYAYSSAEGYSTGLCSRTAAWMSDSASEEVDAEVELLRQHTAPAAPPPQPAPAPSSEPGAAPAHAEVPPGRRGCGGCSTPGSPVAGAWLAVLIVLGGMLRRRRT